LKGKRNEQEEERGERERKKGDKLTHPKESNQPQQEAHYEAEEEILWST
jgi:hypothetical protein